MYNSATLCCLKKSYYGNKKSGMEYIGFVRKNMLWNEEKKIGKILNTRSGF